MSTPQNQLRYERRIHPKIYRSRGQAVGDRATRHQEAIAVQRLVRQMQAWGHHQLGVSFRRSSTFVFGIKVQRYAKVPNAERDSETAMLML